MRLAPAVLALLVSIPLLAGEEKPKHPVETFTCGVLSKVDRGRKGVEARVLCTARNVEHVPEWRLFGADEDMLTDFDEKKQFEFVAPREWRLLEMRVQCSERGELRLRAWVRVYYGEVQFKKYGSED